MKNNIRLDIIHPQKTRVEFFLNNVNETLESVQFDPTELKGVDDIIAGFKFKVAGQQTFVIVIFASSYSQANEIEAANVPINADYKWTINGTILFGVKSPDENTTKAMLSFFAGRE